MIFMDNDERVETYLGDGVYASFDGYHIWLKAERENGWHRIALDPAVMTELQAYVAKVWPRDGKQNDKYGPDAHPDEPLIDAAHKASKLLDRNSGE